jgi:NDP-4-keto-2,6-dideoxyhexose 3-C-methyltransferase
MDPSNNLTICRICNFRTFKNMLSLGAQSDYTVFPSNTTSSDSKTTILFLMCQRCYCLQQNQNVKTPEPLEPNGKSSTISSHLKSYQEEIGNMINFSPYDTIMDIGSNDATFLNCFSSQIRRIGIQPGGASYRPYYNNIDYLTTDFTFQNVKDTFGTITCKLISSNFFLNNVSNPIQTAKDIYNLLDENGIWTCEHNDLWTMLKTSNFDAFSYQDYQYYTLHDMVYLADCTGFKIVDIKRNDFYEGSIRLYLAKNVSTVYNYNVDLVNSYLNEEDSFPFRTTDVYTNYVSSCNANIQQVTNFIQTCGKKVYIYGATVAGNSLLQYANWGPSLIPFAVDEDEEKSGKMTSTGIPIISKDTMYSNMPDYLLVLSSYLREDILQNPDPYLVAYNVKLIFAFPQMEIVSF